MLYHLLYVSTSTKELESDELAKILEISRHENQAQGITGILIYKGRSFIQLLEGEQFVLEQLMKKIEMDDRHFNVKVLIQRPIAKRFFPQWNMMLKDSRVLSQLPDAQSILANVDVLEKLQRRYEEDVVLQLISSF